MEAQLPWGGLAKAQASAGRMWAGFRSVASFGPAPLHDRTQQSCTFGLFIREEGGKRINY